MRAVIQDLVAAEAEARAVVQTARTEAERLRSEAEQRAREMVARARQESADEAAQVIARAVEAAEQEKRRRRQAVEVDIERRFHLAEATQARCAEALARWACGVP